MFACCLSEYLLRAHDWVHMSDNSREAGSLCQVKSNNKLFVDDLKMLFTGEYPLVLQKDLRGSRLAPPLHILNDSHLSSRWPRQQFFSPARKSVPNCTGAVFVVSAQTGACSTDDVSSGGYVISAQPG